MFVFLTKQKDFSCIRMLHTQVTYDIGQSFTSTAISHPYEGSILNAYRTIEGTRL